MIEHHFQFTFEVLNAKANTDAPGSGTVKPRYYEIDWVPCFARYIQCFVIAIVDIYCKYCALYLLKTNSGRNWISPHGSTQQNNRILEMKR